MSRSETLVVWGVQSPLIAGQEFEAHVRAKILDGSPLGSARVLVIDEHDNIVAAQELCGGDGQQSVMQEASLKLHAPEHAGYYPWHAVLERGGKRTAAIRPLPFSVSPKPSRPVTISVADERTGEPLSDATAYLFNKGLSKVKPLMACGDASGVIRTTIVADAAYDVRVEREGYDEGRCSIEADSADNAGQAVVTMRSGLYDNPSLGVGDIALMRDEAAKRQRERMASLELQVRELQAQLAAKG